MCIRDSINLALLAGWCEYNHQTSTNYARDQSIIAYVLVGSALLVFIVIAVVRVVIRVKSVISKQRHAHPLETCQLTAVPAEDEPLPPTVSYIDFNKYSESEFDSWYIILSFLVCDFLVYNMLSECTYCSNINLFVCLHVLVLIRQPYMWMCMVSSKN